jgi:hypothetical protein
MQNQANSRLFLSQIIKTPQRKVRTKTNKRCWKKPIGFENSTFQIIFQKLELLGPELFKGPVPREKDVLMNLNDSFGRNLESPAGIQIFKSPVLLNRASRFKTGFSGLADFALNRLLFAKVAK